MLCHTADPEEKRKIIGDVFVRITDEIVAELNLKPEEVRIADNMISKFSLEWFSLNWQPSEQLFLLNIYDQ